MSCIYQSSIFRNNSKDVYTIKKLLKTHLKFIDAVFLVNQILTPLLIFSFGLTFAMLCVFVFTFFLFTSHFQMLPWFVVSNAILHLHMFSVMLKLLLICDSTAKEETKVIKSLCQMSIDTENEQRRNKVR